MNTVQDILALACTMTGAEEQDRVLLRRLCSGAEQQLRHRLRKGLTVEQCYDSFVSAAAMLAAADFNAACGGLGVQAFSAGPVSVTRSDEAVSRRLREQAALLMAPFCQDAFCFMGVRS